MIDIFKIREDFPILSRKVNNFKFIKNYSLNNNINIINGKSSFNIKKNQINC